MTGETGAALAPFASDFGRLVQGAPEAVARPADSGALLELIQRARREGRTLTPRGQGFSQGGQSVARRGLALDLSALDGVEEPDCEALTVRCQGGARWRTVLERCRPQGLMPRVMPLHLDLTVGGVLSVGGIGASSHIYGPAVSNAINLEVITGQGQKVVVSAARADQPDDLAGAVLGGLGRCGIISQAVLPLRRCAPAVRTFYLLYDSLDAWLDDQQRLCARARPPEWMEAFTTVAGQGLRNGPGGRQPFGIWFYALHLSYEHGPGVADPLPAEVALDGLRPYRLAHVEDAESAAFPHRHEPRFQAMRALGAWEQPHPWVEAFLPLEAAREILPDLLQALPLSLGDGHRLMCLADQRLPWSMAVPDARPLVALAILPPGLPPALRERHLQALAGAHDRLLAAGGKRYLSGWLAQMAGDEAAWRRHYDDRFEDWTLAKRRYDPDGIFASALFPGASAQGEGEVDTWRSR